MIVSWEPRSSLHGDACHAVKALDFMKDHIEMECGFVICHFQAGRIVFNRPITCPRCHEELAHQELPHEYLGSPLPVERRSP